MILDKQLTLSDAQAFGNTGTTVCTNTIDLGAVGTIPGIGGSPIADLGRGNKPELVCQVTEAVTSAGAATVDFQLITSDNADLSSPTVIQTTGAIAKATLVAGYRARLALPVGLTKRYLGVQYVVGTANTTAGKVTSALVLNAGSNMGIS